MAGLYYLITTLSIVLFPGVLNQPLGQVLLSAQTYPNEPTLNLLISEVNLPRDQKGSGMFIEVYTYTNLFKRRNRNDPRDLEGYRLLLIQGSPLQILASVKLSDHLGDLQGKQYFVLGSSSVPSVDIIIEHSESVYSSDMYIPTYDECPYAVVLVFLNDASQMSDLALSQIDGGYMPLSINEDSWRKYIITHAATDMVVIGRKPPSNQCNFFTEIFPSYSMDMKKKYVIRDIDRFSDLDRSINRCCVGLDAEVAFAPWCFKIGTPSPGRPNDCTGPRFIIEDMLDDLAPYDVESGLPDIPGCPVDYPNASPYRYVAMAEEAYYQKLRDAPKPSSIGTCPQMQDQEPMEVDTDDPVEEDDFKRYVPTKFVFPTENFTQCKDNIAHSDLVKRSAASLWLNIDSSCRLSCHVCNEYFRLGWRPDFKRKSQMQRESGFYSTDPAVNYEHIVSHSKNPLHRESLAYYQSLTRAATNAQRKEIVDSVHTREKSLFLPTTNALRLAYTELSVGISFRQHGEVMASVAELGVNLGFKHRNEKSLKNFMSVIATSFHRRLLEYLVKESNFFTVIVDGTTYTNIPYIVVLFQTVENFEPMVYLYSLIPLSQGEESQNMVNDLILRVQDDDKIVPGFENFFKSNCIGLSSDQASVMIGSKKSFYTHLAEYVGKKLALTKCASHRLERAIIHGLDFETDDYHKKYFMTFGKTNNQLFSFYLSRGHKRFREITLLAEDLNLSFYRIKYFWDQRWAASHYKCMTALLRDYDIIKQDLLARASDTSYDRDGKAKAIQLYHDIADKSFPIVVAEFVDFLNVFSGMSKTFQQKCGLLIGNVATVRKGFEKLQQLSANVGHNLQEFLAKCSCLNVCGVGNCTLAEYDDCEEINFNDYPLQRIAPSNIKLSVLRGRLYESLMNQIDSYFQPKVLESFDMFNPLYFNFDCNSDCADLSVCYHPIPSVDPRKDPLPLQEKFKNICTFFMMTNEECGNTLSDWKITLPVILKDASVVLMSNQPPGKFWGNVLRSKRFLRGSAEICCKK